MLELFICSVLFGLLFQVLYKYATKNRDFFTRNGVKFQKPYLLLGNSGVFMFQKKSMGEFISDIYAAFPTERIIGYFDMMTPVYIIRDPEIIKKITTKEFDHFPDHQQMFKNENDTIMGNLLTALAGQKWRDMRSTLSPAFTGSKMRQMFELVTECSDQMAQFFIKKSKAEQVQVLDMKDLFSRFTNDAIATCAFGIKVDSFEQPTNEFFEMGKEVLDFTKIKKIINLMIMRFSPYLASKFDLKVLDENITKFFRRLIIETMAARNEKEIKRPDMINLLMQVRRGDLKHSDESVPETESFATVVESSIGKQNVTKRTWSDDELVAQCLLFFLAGFDTSSTLLSFASNELALNPDIQEKLFNEVIMVHENLNGSPLTYEALQSMRYMDMVVSETLRKWPPAPFTDRKCDKDFQLNEGENLKFTISKGQQLWLPIYALHHDPNYFPDPEKFDPERFSEENSGKILGGTYFPFGIGPRNCIGSRFALMNIKAVLYHMLKDFQFEMCQKTVMPLQMGKMTIVPAKGIHLGLRARTLTGRS